jgi:hypothetical protein
VESATTLADSSLDSWPLKTIWPTYETDQDLKKGTTESIPSQSNIVKLQTGQPWDRRNTKEWETIPMSHFVQLHSLTDAVSGN